MAASSTVLRRLAPSSSNRSWIARLSSRNPSRSSSIAPRTSPSSSSALAEVAAPTDVTTRSNRSSITARCAAVASSNPLVTARPCADSSSRCCRTACCCCSSNAVT